MVSTATFLMDFLTETWFIPEIIKKFLLRLLLYVARIPKSPKYINECNRELIASLKTMPICLKAEESNSPYELPAEFYEQFLGPRVKYSACYFSNVQMSLEDAELKSLELYCEKIRLEDGMAVCDLGCGWGALSFYIAQNYPHCIIYAISISKSQTAYIKSRILDLKLSNVIAVSADLAKYEPPLRFDRIFCIEILEYLKNYQLVFSTLSHWLVSDGEIFIQAFAHKERLFEMTIPDNESWLAKFFCRGGTLPSKDLFLYFQKDLLLKDHFVESGSHYRLTAERYLYRMTKNKAAILDILTKHFKSKKVAELTLRRYRFALIVLAEMFRSPEFLITYYIFIKRE
jgi:cyclopropane-fatty-acyl-phospholipid synthase